MIIDKLLSPAIDLALSTLTVSTQTLGTAMDWGSAKSQGLLSTPYGPGWEINVRGATSGGASTLTLLLVTDDNAAFSSATTLYTTGAIALASLVTYDLWLPLPNVTTWERYVGWRATVGTAVFTGGTLSVEYAANNRNYRAYPAQGNM